MKKRPDDERQDPRLTKALQILCLVFLGLYLLAGFTFWLLKQTL